jgi:hypothetical protein
MRRDVAVGLALPLAAAAGGLLAYAAIGEISEPGGEDVMLTLPQGRAVPAVLGLVALALLVGHVIVRWRLPVPLPREAWYLLALSAILGVGLGCSLRVVSARVGGANIGGGLIVLIGPLVAITLLAYARRWWAALPPD